MIDKLSKRELFKIFPFGPFPWSRFLGQAGLVLIAFGLAGTGPALAGQVPFASIQTIDASFDGAISLDAGDIDGDGDLDVVGAATVAGDISWWANGGDGSSWTESLVDGGFSQVQSVRLVDIDSDGDLDILGASLGDSTIRVWRNTSDGSSWQVTTIQSGFANASFAAAGDFNGDGRMDVVGGAVTGVTWWNNRFGTATFWERNDIELTGDQPTSLHVADVDGDGDSDVLATMAGTDEVIWYDNAGNGAAWTRRSIATAFDGAQSVVAEDMDGDGDLDVVGAALIDNEILWWQNTVGDGSAWTEHVVDADFDQASSIAVRDVDADGDFDLVGAAAAFGEIQWWENVDGSGMTWNAYVLPDIFFGAAAAITGDVDGDGDVDVLGAALGADDIAWWENLSIHRSAAYPVENPVASSLGQPRSVHAADIDGDGDEDLLGTAAADGDILWWENTNGDGSAWTEHVIDADFADANGVYTGDIDGDGDLDVAATSGSLGTVAWWQNTLGDATAWSKGIIATGFPQASVPQVIDIDEDGDLDVMAVSPQFFRINFWINLDGVGGSWFQRIAQGNYPGARSAHAADLDGDARPDLVTVASLFNAVAIVRNPVIGFQTTIIDNNFPEAYAAFAADLDGDGDRDLIAGSRSTGEIAWWDNTDGAGTFAARQALETSFVGVNWLRAADLDQDGDIDIYATSENSNEVAWWENAGGATGWTRHQAAGALGQAVAIYQGDPDGDGDLDLVAAGLDGDVSWWPNRGGEFSLPTADIAPAVVADGSSVAALRIDATHRGRAGDSAVELVTVEILLESLSETPLSDVEADDLLAELSLYADDGSGSFESANDTEIASIQSFTLDAGVATLAIADDQSAAQVGAASSRSYFVVPTFEATASATGLSPFRFTHLTESSSTGEDAANDIPLALEYAANVQSSAISFNQAPVAQDDALTLFEDQSASANVLDGTAGGLDTDAEAGALSAILVDPPVNGVLIGGLGANGDFQYAPGLNFNGVDTFTYRANDGFESSNLATVTLTVTAVNDPPSFQIAADHDSNEDGGPQVVPGFATSLTPGPADESGQSLSFSVIDNTDPSLFAAPPGLASDGTLTYTAAADAVGTATVTVALMDDGGTANGGEDQSEGQSFDIVVAAINDAPSFTLSAQHVSDEDGGAQSVPLFAINIAPGPADESGQAVNFSVTGNTNPSLFSTAPALAADGTLTYEAAPDANGMANVTVRLMDDGGTAGGGVDQSAEQSFEILVIAINDAPSFSLSAASHVSAEDEGPIAVPSFAQNISAGPADESGQGLIFTISGNSAPALFAVPPAISSDGTLTYEAAAEANGIAMVTATLMDDGGTASGGVDTSAGLEFEIEVGGVNDAPSFTVTAQHVSNEDGGAQSVADFATSIVAGPADESGQMVMFEVMDNSFPGLFSAAPVLAPDGTLSYTAAADANGVATITVSLMDDGGTANGGVDQSAEQSFDIQVTPVNDAPSFSVPASTVISASTEPQELVGFAANLSAGPADEAGQELLFEVTDNSAPELFAAGPELASDGALSFTLVAGISEMSATITALVRDDGGTALGGVDTSQPQAFELVVPDVAAPQIASVDALPGGPLLECSEFRQGFGRLEVRFNEAMANQSGSEPGDATNPENYQLFKSGPDQDVTSVACGPADGDDLRFLPSAVSLDLDGDTATVELPMALGDGLYKLLVCDTVEDAGGNALSESLAVAFRVDATNLFANGQLDCDINSWTAVIVEESFGGEGGVETGGDVDYSSEDADDSNLSGSIDIVGLAGQSFAVGQCLDVASSTYDLAARVRIEGLSDVEVTIDLRCESFAGPECTGASLGESSSQTVLPPTAGVWQLMEHGAAGGESAICGVDLHLTAGSSFEAFVDQLSATVTLFGDGFESGGLDAWTMAVP